MNRWEISQLWARNFSPLLQPAVLRAFRRDFSIDEITNAFSVNGGLGYQLIPAVQGYLYSPIQGIIIRSTAYATVPTGLQITTPSHLGAAINFAGTALTAAPVISNDGALRYTAWSTGVGTLNAFNATDPNYGSQALYLWASVGNPTVSAAFPGSVVTLYLTYYLLPTYAEVIGN